MYSMKYELPKLPYGYDALEPYIDAKTMELHHTKHHQAYVNNLNAALEKHPEIADRPLKELLHDIEAVSEDILGRGAQPRRRAREPLVLLDDHGTERGR